MGHLLKIKHFIGIFSGKQPSFGLMYIFSVEKIKYPASQLLKINADGTIIQHANEKASVRLPEALV